MSWIVIALIWIVRVLGILVVLGAMLPWIRSGSWFIRAWDFPRVQLGVLGLGFAIVLGVWMLFGVRSKFDVLLIPLLLASVVVQSVYILPFTPLYPRRIATSGSPGLSLLVANIEYSSSDHAGVRTVLDEENPDVLLLIEANGGWIDALSKIRERYPHRLEAIREEGLGLVLWSRVPLGDARVRHMVTDDRPSLWVDLDLEGAPSVRLVGIHPTPPALKKPERPAERYNSRIRDAELIRIAREASDDPETAWIVAGDFNDVAWSHTTSLFRDLSGLRDPRVGRTLLNTYHAEYPPLRYPLDHVFVSPTVKVGRFDRVRIPGSDHFGMFIELEFARDKGRQTNGATREQEHHADEMVREGNADAAEDG